MKELKALNKRTAPKSVAPEKIFPVSESFVLLTSRIMNKNVLNQQPQNKKKNRSLQVTSALY